MSLIRSRFCVLDRFVTKQPSCMKFTPSCGSGVKFSTSNRLGDNSSNPDGSNVKPDLRKAPDSRRKFIIITCIVAAILMYPSIFRPLFGMVSLGDRDAERIRSELAKTRPEHMREWTSPFGPKNPEDR